MPVPPTSISAATITSHAMPIEIRMPVTIVGAAAGRITVSARFHAGTSSVRATFSHSRRTDATPNAVLISIGQTEQMKITNTADAFRSEEHTSELQSRENLVCRLLLEKKTREQL